MVIATLKRGLRNIHHLISPRARRVAKNVARESLQEGRRVGHKINAELKTQAPKIKKAAAQESRVFAENIKHAVEDKPKRSSKKRKSSKPRKRK